MVKFSGYYKIGKLTDISKLRFLKCHRQIYTLVPVQNEKLSLKYTLFLIANFPLPLHAHMYILPRQYLLCHMLNLFLLPLLSVGWLRLVDE